MNTTSRATVSHNSSRNTLDAYEPTSTGQARISTHSHLGQPSTYIPDNDEYVYRRFKQVVELQLV